MDRNRQTGRPFNDNLCFFRALALHNGCHTKNLERDAHHYYQVYRQAKPDIKKFCGVTFKELSDLEQLFEVNILVYSLEPTKLDEDDDGNGEYDDQSKPKLSAELLYRSFRQYSSTLYLNLYQNHFSYITDMKKYSKSYSCSRCGKYYFSSVFDAIDQKLEEIKQQSDQSTRESNIQEGSDDKADLMETDDDEDEEIESEKEDQAFLDNEVEEEQGPSFYRALDREREDEDSNEDYVQHKPEVTSTEPTKKKEHPLKKKLRDRLVEYLKELPVIGFNSGKYDLNAVKKFLFPFLVKNEQAMTTFIPY
ncbi:hypothetical protein ACROYT_G007026 [Oculina patagonica]